MRTNFSEVLAAARKGDEAAQADLYDNHSVLVRRAVRRFLPAQIRSKADSVDVVQSVFADVLRDLPRFEDRGQPAFQRWLYIKARHKVWSKLRQYWGADGARKERTLGVAETMPARSQGPDRVAATRERYFLLQASLAQLEPAAREVVRLRLEEELSFQEIAERASLPSADAARKRYARAVKALRKLGSGQQKPRESA